MRKDVLAGVGVGAALLGGAAFYYFREKVDRRSPTIARWKPTATIRSATIRR